MKFGAHMVFKYTGHNQYMWCRSLEDFGVVYLGSAIFKISRLTFIALFFVHLFACIFFRVKESSAASVDDVVAFYASKNIQENVSVIISWNSDAPFFQTKHCIILFYFSFQDLSSQYVRQYEFLPYPSHSC